MQEPPPPKVLVVDDSEQNRALAEETLRVEGYDVVTATTGEHALEVFVREAPDLVLLDVRMPGLDGFATCTRLRALPRGDETPVVFLTALRDLETFDRASRAGADDFLTKPVRPAELVTRVQTLLRIRQLSAELHDHFRVIRKQRDDLVRLQLQKEQLVSFVVHDLKSPVSSIELHAHLLAREASLSADGKESAAWIVREVQTMKRLVMNLLDIGKADDGKLDPRRSSVDVGAVAVAVANAAGVRAAERDQRLLVQVASGLPAIEADVDLVRRVFENLVDNALRYAPRGAPVSIGVSAGEGPFVVVRVADTGPGIPESMHERIFDRYVQVDALPGSDTRAGRGLGLAFCRLAVEAHGGSIWIDPAAQGTVFCFRLPHGR
ncbi:hybrid sensor histidine kinase/response regulator [Polyangium sp. y55x31]|uniref:hybrid sensor histidine kinase/response regulator n=1 Tax=Polyangium sp. y55x31 TaxID=3042688 RepID=UPI00248271BE|nr:hybrid sensor histidine kinase/response regulator [Polyangium sp. y55x31]MDI1480464.1 hybrid sensor histidine kinase/response regulator [Polyangium sp. y55x31]